MMIGVAQVMGTKPTFSFFFSGTPTVSARASCARRIGNTWSMTAATVAAPST